MEKENPGEAEKTATQAGAKEKTNGIFARFKKKPSFLSGGENVAKGESAIKEKSAFLGTRSVAGEEAKTPEIDKEASREGLLFSAPAALYKLIDKKWDKIGSGRFMGKKEALPGTASAERTRVLFAMEKTERIILNSWVEEKSNLKLSNGRILITAYSESGCAIYCIIFPAASTAKEAFEAIAPSSN